MEVTVELHCDACGSANYTLEDHAADAGMRCNDCGAYQGKVSELKAAIADAAIAQSAAALRRNLRELDDTGKERT